MNRDGQASPSFAKSCPKPFWGRNLKVGARDGVPFEFPKPAFAEDPMGDLFAQNLEPHRTAWDAMGDLDARVGAGVIGARMQKSRILDPRTPLT